MASSFDANDRNSWYYGSMSRQDATDLLLNERESGVFLVRDSNSIIGDFVLCVKEDTKVSHYIINKKKDQDQYVYRIGDQSFSDLPELLSFYKLHYLDTTPLRRPVTRKFEKVIGKFDFDGSDQDDLPFKRGEILTIISKDEDQWWTAKNALGKIGQIPVPYVQKYEDNPSNLIERPGSGSSGGGGGGGGGVVTCVTIGNKNLCSGTGIIQNSHQLGNTLKKSDLNRQLPAFARVKQARVPNAYDKTALKLEVDDIIKVTKTNINGQWEGELKGKKGHFPFTHVEFIDNDELINMTTTNSTMIISSSAAVAAAAAAASVTVNNCNNSTITSATTTATATTGCGAGIINVGTSSDGNKCSGNASEIIISNNEWGD